ncbi:MAG: hypothetical protein WCX64_01525 [Candidatus Micrarchaeia archaeon]
MEKNAGKGRGIAFAIDALFAIAVVAAFAITVVPASSGLQDAGDAAPRAASKLSESTLRAMCLATASELSAASPEIAAIYSDGNLTANDSEMTLCQLLARLEAEGNGSVLRAKNVTAQVFGPLVPQTMGLAVYADGALIYNTTFEPPAPIALHSSAAYVYSYGKAGVSTAPIGPVKIEARSWWP